MGRIRSSASASMKLLSASPQAIYLLDADRRILFANAALCDFAGIPAEELIGTICDYHSQKSTAIEQAANRLCPPPDSFTCEHNTRGSVSALVNNQIVKRAAEFVPLGATKSREQEMSAGMLVILRDSLPVQAETPASLHQKIDQLRRELAQPYRLDRVLGESPAAVRMRAQLQLAAGSFAATVILGPSGSGREHIARAIHAGSPGGPLAPLACPLLDAELLQSSVLSLVRHSDTLESPQQGTLLLLDVDSLSHSGQLELAGLLRLPTLKLRTIATSRRPLGELVREQSFHEELAQKLSTLVMESPPLADRLEDLPLLAQCFLEEENAGRTKQLAGFTPEALDRLALYPWPENIDELANVVRESCKVAKGVWIEASDLPRRIGFAEDAAARPPRAAPPIELDAVLQKVESELLQRALAQANGNKSKAAKLLGLTRPRFLRRLEATQ